MRFVYDHNAWIEKCIPLFQNFRSKTTTIILKVTAQSFKKSIVTLGTRKGLSQAVTSCTSFL